VKMLGRQQLAAFGPAAPPLENRRATWRRSSRACLGERRGRRRGGVQVQVEKPLEEENCTAAAQALGSLQTVEARSNRKAVEEQSGSGHKARLSARRRC